MGQSGGRSRPGDKIWWQSKNGATWKSCEGDEGAKGCKVGGAMWNGRTAASICSILLDANSIVPC
eukprot:10465255-Prorocentrum_lima.AAC.1